MTSATPLRVFLSFDLEHDQDLHDRLLAQAGQRTSFEISDQSEDGAVTQSWTERARKRISASDEVVIICGEHSHKSSRMSAELRLAQEMKKPYVLLWGRRQQMCKKPRSARSGDGIYLWTPEILEDQIISTMSWRSQRPA
jgi:antiphage defense system Thoeris ThsB-like protein